MAAVSGAKAQQACYDQSAEGLAARFRLLAGAPPTCQPLVKTNWAFFDMSRPRSQPQILILAAYARCLTKEQLAADKTYRGGCNINRELVGSIDWPAVRAWLNR